MAIVKYDKLIPSGEALTNLDDLPKILAFAKIEVDAWKTIAAKLGDEGLDDLVVVAGMSPSVMRTAMEEAGVNPIIRVKVSLVFSIIHAKFGMEAVDPSAPLQVSSPAAPALAAGHEEKPDKLRVRDYFDQGSRLEVLPLASDRLAQLRAVWVAAKGNDPSDKKKLTDNQLTVLFQIIEKGGNPVAFDSGLWGPGGRKRERNQLLTAHHKNSLGAWVTKEIPAAASLEEWKIVWEFSQAGVFCCEAIDESTMDMYKESFATRAERFPSEWAVCAEADISCRFEWMEAELQRQVRFHSQHPELSSFDPKRPWNSVVLAAAKGSESYEFWQTHLVEKARDLISAKQAQLLQQGAAAQGRGSLNFGVPSPPGQGKRSQKRSRTEAWQPLPTPPMPPGGATDGFSPPPAARSRDQRRPDGRWMTDLNDVELCYAWGRNSSGCDDHGCISRPPRAHGCEWCRGNHRSINCPTHPGWNPNAGKGQGKKGHKAGGKRHK